MSRHRSQRGGDVAAGGGSSGSTSADGEVRVGLTDLILGNGPEAPQYGRVFSQAASLRFSTQYADQAKYGPQQQGAVDLVWTATRRSRSRVLCCRLRNCCESLSVHACREPISMERNCRTTISARLLLSTHSVGRVILLIRLLRRHRCAIV